MSGEIERERLTCYTSTTHIRRRLTCLYAFSFVVIVSGSGSVMNFCSLRVAVPAVIVVINFFLMVCDCGLHDELIEIVGFVRGGVVDIDPES